MAGRNRSSRGGSVYVIKNRDGSRIVGESAHSPGKRLDQHKKGENSRHVTRDGVRPESIDWSRTKTGIDDREERLQLEKEIARDLYNEGYTVYGNGLPPHLRGR